jgi:hypothetical protein
MRRKKKSDLKGKESRKKCVCILKYKEKNID